MQTLWYQILIYKGFKGVKTWYEYESVFTKHNIVISINQTATLCSIIVVTNYHLIGKICDLGGSRNIDITQNKNLPVIVLDSTWTGINTVATRIVCKKLNSLYKLGGREKRD